VSGVGDDVNPCSRTAPCKTFAGAISKTAVGGEIDALDPGGFGAVTITKAITIDGGGGQVASILASGVNGIVVAAGAGDVVTLRNLRINGAGGGLNGILYNSGLSVIVEHSNIFGFSGDGIHVATAAAATLVVHDTHITHNANGVQLVPTGGAVAAGFRDVRSEANTTAGFLLGAASAALIDQSSALLNGTGITVNAGGLLFLGNSEVVGNGTGVNVVLGGTANSYKTNEIDGNGTNVNGTLTVIPLK